MHPTAVVSRITRPGFETTPSGRRVSVAGAVYVAAWVIGLVMGPAAPSATAPDAEIHSFYLDHGPATMVQSSLIHGLAGLALAVLALTVPTATHAASTLRRVIVCSGLAAAAVSLIQVAFAAAAVHSASSAAASTSAALFNAINVADTVKLVLLAVFAGVVTLAATRAGICPRWVRVMTAILVVLLLFGGAAFLAHTAVLTAMLYASLPLLLAWAASTSWYVGRRARQ
jgi:hypothetical protein